MVNISKLITDIEKGFPVTRYPKTIPKIQNKIVSWKTDGNETVGISLGAQGQHAHGDSLIFIQDSLTQFQYFTCPDSKILIPRNALTVSFSLKNFTVGRSAQEFIPSNPMPSDAFFSYQMLSKHCQATFYNENGIAFLAGICYYLQLRSSFTVTSELDDYVMKEAYLAHQQYPLVDRWETTMFKTYKAYGRFCKKAKRQVVVKHSEAQGPVHQYYNYRTREYEYKYCSECASDAKEPIKSEEQITKEILEHVDKMVAEKKAEEAKAKDLKAEEKEFDFGDEASGDEKEDEEEEEFDFAIDLNKN